MPAHMHVWNGERATVGQWRDLEGCGVIAPRPGDTSPSVEFVDHCCRLLADRGFKQVVTPALQSTELIPFLQAGFVSREQLHVLVHDLGELPETRELRGFSLRRGRPTDLEAVLEVDAAAFDAFWRFDEAAFSEACAATPQARFRVAVTDVTLPAGNLPAGHVPSGSIVGYCVTGRSRHQGFLQRLAVAPAAQGFGVGRTLTIDALAWLSRRRARTCIVNTQESNMKAARLYLDCGFQMAPSGLYVLMRPLEEDALR